MSNYDYDFFLNREAVANPFQTLNSGELVDKLASSLDDHQLIAIFMQDDVMLRVIYLIIYFNSFL